MNTLSAQEQNQRLSLNLKQTSLENVLRQIEQQTNFHFLYNNNFIDVDKKVDIQVSNVLVPEILEQLFKDGTIKYQIKDNQIILSPKTLVKNNQENQQKPVTRKISGKVIDEDGYEVPGVTIAIAGTTKGTTTDANGEFSLTLSGNEKDLICSCVGMLTETISVKDKTRIEIKLKYNRELLNELIVTGYQTISREQSTGSYVTVNSEALEGKLQTNIMSRLEGQVPGLLQNQGKISLRGIVSLKGATQPLYVVDGTPFEGDIKSINPSIIDNITILKDAAAASIYGARAANGVIVISTKRGTTDGRTHISYEGSVKATPIPNIDYLNLINSSELVDVQVAGFKYRTDRWQDQNSRAALDPVLELLYKNKAGLITADELEKGLNVYRSLDNREQIKKDLLRTGLTHQHNVTLTGGNEKNRYITSLNYIGDYGQQNRAKDEQMGFTFRNNIQFFSWLKSDFGVAGTFTTISRQDGIRSIDQLLERMASYHMLRDKDGNPAVMPMEKSRAELNRLISVGLKDETYYPLKDMAEETTVDKNNYYRIHAGLNIKLSESLNVDLNYQTEYASGRKKELASEKSYTKNHTPCAT